jgi:hypothetical protein
VGGPKFNPQYGKKRKSLKKIRSPEHEGKNNAGSWKIEQKGLYVQGGPSSSG